MIFDNIILPCVCMHVPIIKSAAMVGVLGDETMGAFDWKSKPLVWDAN